MHEIMTRILRGDMDKPGSLAPWISGAIVGLGLDWEITSPALKGHFSADI